VPATAVLSVIVIMGPRYYGYTSNIVDILDASLDKHGALAMVVHNSSRYSP
jgi:hypothetical protein